VAATSVCGLLLWLTPDNWRLAARQVDDQFDLHDRATTALEADQHGDKTIWKMQQREAVATLSAQRLTTAAPVSLPGGLAVTALMLVAALVLLFWPLDVFTPAYDHIPPPEKTAAFNPTAPTSPAAALTIPMRKSQDHAAELTAATAVQKYFAQQGGE